MGWLDRFRGAPKDVAADRVEPRASSMQSASGGLTVTTAAELEAALTGSQISGSGTIVNAETAMRVSACYACIRLISGAVATMPLRPMRRIDARHREEANQHPLWAVLKRRPNRWQTPSQFKRMMEAHKLLRGNAYAYIVWSLGRVLEVIPLHPDRVTVTQLADSSLEYRYVGPNGSVRTFTQAEIFHLVGLTLDGFRGVTPITYARETIGAAIAMEQHGANLFRNGAQIGSYFKVPAGANLNNAQYTRLKASLDAYRNGGDRAGGQLLLEDGMEVGSMAMNMADSQWIESRKLSRSDVAMFYGVPPSMIGDNTGSDSNWGTGLEQKAQGFVTFTLEDDLTAWEETCERDLLRPDETDIYVQFNRAALVKGDLAARKGYYVSALQWGWMSPDEVRALEDMNPRADGEGDKYYDPPNTAGNTEAPNGGAIDPQKTS